MDYTRANLHTCIQWVTALACLNSTTAAAGTQARIRMCGGGQLEIGGRHKWVKSCGYTTNKQCKSPLNIVICIKVRNKQTHRLIRHKTCSVSIASIDFYWRFLLKTCLCLRNICCQALLFKITKFVTRQGQKSLKKSLGTMKVICHWQGPESY